MGKSAAELASEMEANPRTIYRDLDALQEAGFPIYTERVDGKNLWSLLDTMKHQIPIPFNLMELMALYFSRDMMKVFKDTVFYDNLESLFNKIKATLPKESLTYLGKTEQILQMGIKPYKDYGRFREIINRVSEAAIQKKSIEIVYYTMSRKKESRRKVDPYRIWFFNGTFYLIGFCHFRKEVRIFALDRIKMLHQTKDSFEILQDFDLDEFLGASFGVYVGTPVKVRILFSAEVAGFIREKVWHESQKLEPREDGSLIFEATVAGAEEIKQWVLGWGSQAQVIEPEKLKNEIYSEAIATLNLYREDIQVNESDIWYGDPQEVR
jgi:predicted DNA-binding transcriptional regulator YafY